MPTVGGGKSKNVFLWIIIIEQHTWNFLALFLLGFDTLRSFELSNSFVAQLYQKLVVGHNSIHPLPKLLAKGM